MIVARYWPICEHCERYMQRGRQVGGAEFCPEYEYTCACKQIARRKTGRYAASSERAR